MKTDVRETEFRERYGEAMMGVSKVLAGEAEPTRKLFMEMAEIMTVVLTTLEGALAQIEKTQRNKAKRERRIQ